MSVAKALWTAFEAVEPSRLPAWYPQSDGLGRVRIEVDAAITAVRAESQRSGFWKLAQSRDLVGATKEAVLNDSQSRTIEQMVSSDTLVEL